MVRLAALLDGGITVQRAILDSAALGGSNQSSPAEETRRWLSWHISRFWVAAVSEVWICWIARGANGTACETTMWSRTFSVLVQVLCTLLSCLSRSVHVYHHIQLAQVTEEQCTAVSLVLCRM
jgi:hypothetical protein